MIWLPEERTAEHAPDPVSMSYTARHPRCGHIRAIGLDRRNGSLDDFVSMGFAGLLLSREPTAGLVIGECDICRDPEQDELGL